MLLNLSGSSKDITESRAKKAAATPQRKDESASESLNDDDKELRNNYENKSAESSAIDAKSPQEKNKSGGDTQSSDHDYHDEHDSSIERGDCSKLILYLCLPSHFL